VKKALRETQTLHAGCSKVEPKLFAPPQTPFPGAQDGQNLIIWRWSLPLPTDQWLKWDPVWRRSMHAISSYRGNRPTNKHTGPITIHCTAKLSARCNKNVSPECGCWTGSAKLLPVNPVILVHNQKHKRATLATLRAIWSRDEITHKW